MRRFSRPLAFQTWAHHPSAEISVQTYLFSQGFVPYSESGIAVTWIELFASFTLTAEASLGGVPAPAPLSRDLLRPRGSLKEALDTFKRLV